MTRFKQCTTRCVNHTTSVTICEIFGASDPCITKVLLNPLKYLLPATQATLKTFPLGLSEMTGNNC